MHRLILHLAVWVLSHLVPKAEREALLGDLVEEHALRAAVSSPCAALRWCLRQVLASALPLVGMTVIRGAWLSTAGVALLAYIAVGVTEQLIHGALALFSQHPTAYNLAGLAITFPPVILIGYATAALRRHSPVILAAMMLAAVTLMTIFSTEKVPLAFHAAYLVAGPGAALIGSLWHGQRHRRG